MQGRWNKLGLIYNANQEHDWQYSHAYIPVPYLLNEDTIRMYVSFLDQSRVGRIGYIDVDAANPKLVKAVSQTPCLDIGDPGCFDDNGVTAISVIEDEGRLLLYYIGWELSDKVRYKLFVGLSQSHDGGETFERVQKTPILERSDNEMTVRTASHVMREGDVWKMWYIGGSDTIIVDGKQVPTYDMRYIESDDGLHWPREGRIILVPEGDDEYGFGRPYICPVNGGGYEMWYSVRARSTGYHLGYATSNDAINWQRKDDQAGIFMSDTGWDSEMIAFGAVCDAPHGRYMFYNGNNFGETGVGVAVFED